MIDHDRQASGSEASTVKGAGYAKQVPLGALQEQLLALSALRQELQQLQRRSSSLSEQLEQRLEELSQVRQQRSEVAALESRAAEHRRLAGLLRGRSAELRQRAGAVRGVLLAQAYALTRGCDAIKAARRRACDAHDALHGPEGVGRWLEARDRLVYRRCMLARQLGEVFQIGPRLVSEVPAGGFLEERMDWSWWTGGDVASLASEDDDDARSHASSAAVSVFSAATSGAPANGSGAHGGHGYGGGFGGFNQYGGGGGGAAGGSLPPKEVVKMAICDLELPAGLGRPGGGHLERDLANLRGAWDDASVGAALGHVAHAVARLAAYLGLPLRYPLRFRGSRSVVLDQYGPAAIRPAAGGGSCPPSAGGSGSRAHGQQQQQGDNEDASSPGSRYEHMFGDGSDWAVVRPGGGPGGDGWVPRKAGAGELALAPMELPLSYQGTEATRFAYATFLLSKDIEQLLVAHGLAPASPTQMLHNLHKLLMLAASAVGQ